MKKSFYLLPIFLATLTVNAQQTYTFDCNGTEITISIEEYQAFSQTDFNFDDVIDDADLLFLYGCDDESTGLDFEGDIDAEIPEDLDLNDLVDSLGLNFIDGSVDFTCTGDSILIEEYQGNSLLDFDGLIDFLELNFNDGSVYFTDFIDNIIDFDNQTTDLDNFDFTDISDTILIEDYEGDSQTDFDGLIDFLDLSFNDGSVYFTDFIGNIIDFDNQIIDLDNFDYTVIADTFFINDICILNNGEEFDFSFQNNSYVFNRMSAPSSVLEQKELIEILDLQGRPVSFRPNQPLIYLFKDGTFEKRMTLDR
ncbi:MAG: hypothetical protein ACON4E_01100 [Flavobacteriales bacterium]